MLDALADRLLPPRCLLCGRAGQQPGFDLCAACESELPHNEFACGRCGLPRPEAAVQGSDPGHHGACALCTGQPLPFERCIAPLLYEFPVTTLVPALKYEDALSHARVLGLLLARHVRRCAGARDVDRVVPMPLHPTRLVERGYNQSHEIARFTAADLGLALVPRALRRVRPTTPQVGLDRSARHDNVRGAFAADAALARGFRLALLDDVVTTASTVEAAARALLDAGARSVDVWCVARAQG